jgi:TonB family protein
MKRCPSCNRTYADESISFCLADGSLLSAPYDSSRKEAPPTEKMPSTTRPAVPPTQPSKTPVPTITSFPGQHRFTATEDNAIPSRRNRRPLFWTIAAVVGVAVFLVIVFAVRNRTNDRNEQVTASDAQGTPLGFDNLSSPSTSPSLSPSKDSVVTVPPATSTSPEKSKTDDVKSNTALVDQRPIPTPTAAPSIDYTKIFSGKEVNSKARILSKPEPTYTEEARKNQITGTVVLRVVLSSSGQVTNIEAVSGLPYGLTERAISAARSLQFVPATKDGHPVSTRMELQYNFNLY